MEKNMKKYIYICIYICIYIYYIHICIYIRVCVCVCVYIYIYMDFPGSSAGKESSCNAGDPCSIHGLGSSSEEGIDYPL